MTSSPDTSPAHPIPKTWSRAFFLGSLPGLFWIGLFALGSIWHPHAVIWNSPPVGVPDGRWPLWIHAFFGIAYGLALPMGFATPGCALFHTAFFGWAALRSLFRKQFRLSGFASLYLLLSLAIAAGGLSSMGSFFMDGLQGDCPPHFF